MKSLKKKKYSKYFTHRNDRLRQLFLAYMRKRIFRGIVEKEVTPFTQNFFIPSLYCLHRTLAISTAWMKSILFQYTQHIRDGYDDDDGKNI